MYVELREAESPTALQRWYLVLVGKNGEPLAHSEHYFSKGNARRAAKKNFVGIELRDPTEKEYRKFGP